MDGAQKLGTGTLSASSSGSATASFATSTLAPGAHSITAVYGGDSQHSGDTSAVVTETIRGQTATTLTTSGSPAAVDSAITLTATVSESGTGGIAPSGTVVFYDGAAVIGTQTVDSTGNAMLTISSLSVGTHVLTADYNGDTYNQGSDSAQVSEKIVQEATTTALSASVNPTVYGNSVTYTATVTVQGSGTATGTVDLIDEAQELPAHR